uniref:Uncharacterized protein n=1 Tax=Arundo donax TaxID=35708 RepID=A0A0A9EMM1_ARUDO
METTDQVLVQCAEIRAFSSETSDGT